MAAIRTVGRAAASRHDKVPACEISHNQSRGSYAPYAYQTAEPAVPLALKGLPLQ